MGSTRLVAAREFSERLRSKAFLLSAGFILLLIAGVVGLQFVLQPDDGTPVGVVDDRTEEIARAAEAQQAGFGAQIEITRVATEDARDLVRDGDLAAAVVDPTTLVSGDDLPRSVEALLTSGAQAVALEESLAHAGLSPLERRVLFEAGTALRTEPVDPDADEDPLAGPAPLTALVGVLLLYGLVAVFGQWVSQGIVEEKQSRVVEVLLSSVTPRQLLAGKVIGLGLLGILQVVVIVAIGFGGAIASGAVEPPEDTAGVVAALVGWFVLGYALYATVFAIAGALVPRVEELQATQTPVLVLIIGALFGAQFALFNPTSAVSQALAYVPFTSPLVQPVRIAAGLSSPIEVIGAVVIVLVTLAVLVPVAARVYERAVLQTRVRVSLRGVLRRGS